MKKQLIFKITFAFLLSHILYLYSHAQNANIVTKVKYMLTFDNEVANSVHYDFNIIVAEGNASSIPARAMFNSQMSIVTPAFSVFQIFEHIMPLVDNQNYLGNTPTVYKISDNANAPVDQPESSFFAIVPSVNPGVFFNDLLEGDTVTLFSFKVLGDDDVCNFSTRIFDNQEDPKSSAAGMGGGDFSNGFTIGGSAQKYNGNATTYIKYGTDALQVQEQTICPGECATLVVDFICPDHIASINWENGSNDPSIIVCPESTSEYTVQIETNNGQFLNTKSKVNILPLSDPACIVSSDDEALIHCEIHPNPSSDYVTIDSEHGISSIQLINASGQLMASYPYNSERAITLDMTQYTVGMYILDLTLANGKKVNRQLVKK